MDNEEKVQFDLTLIPGPGINLRKLDELRADLFDYLKQELPSKTAILIQPEASRSLDPEVIGTIGLVVLPIVLEKIGDLIVKWAELKKDPPATMTIKKTITGGSVVITVPFDPKTATAKSIRDLIKTSGDAMDRPRGKSD